MLPSTVFVSTNRVGGRVDLRDPQHASDEDCAWLGGCDTSFIRRLLLAQSILVLIVLGLFATLAWSSRPFLRAAGEDSLTLCERGRTYSNNSNTRLHRALHPDIVSVHKLAECVARRTVWTAFLCAF